MANSFYTQNAPEFWSGILSAAQKNDVNTVRILLSRGCPPSHPNGVGQTGLHIAAMWGNWEVVRVLIDAGANVDAQNFIAKSTPLHCAVRGTFQSFAQTHQNRIECARLLLEAGADVKLQDTRGSDAFQTIDDTIKESNNRDLGDIEAEMAEMKQLFLQCGGVTISRLERCIDSNDYDGMREALRDTNAPPSQSEKNESLLNIIYKIEYLIENESEDRLKYKLYSDMVSALLENGANANTFPTPNESPQPMDEAPLHILCKLLVTTTPSSSGVELDCVTAVVQALKTHGAKVNASTMTLVPTLAVRNQIKLIKFFLETVGVDVNTRGRQEMTTLILAARGGKTEIVKYLATYDNLDVEAKDSAGKTAMDYAQRNNKQAVIDLLLARNLNDSVAAK